MRPVGGRGGITKDWFSLLVSELGYPVCTLGTPRNGDWVPAGCKDNFGFITVRLRAWIKDGACVGAVECDGGFTSRYLKAPGPMAWHLTSTTRRLVYQVLHSLKINNQKIKHPALRPLRPSKDLRSQKRSGICGSSDIAGLGL